MYVHYDRRLIYLAHPRTASRATRYVLRQHGFKSRNTHHATLEENPGDGWTVFTTVRNHFDTWTSWYFYFGAGSKLSADFIRSLSDRKSQYWPVDGRMWGLHSRFADVLIRYEHLESDLSALLGTSIELPEYGVGERRAGRHYRDVMRPDARAFIEDYYRAELDELAYSW